jgi:hypothetical protein
MARSIASSDDGQTSRRLLKKVEMPTSNASFVSIGSDYAGPAVPVTSSTSPLPPRTSGSSPS